MTSRKLWRHHCAYLKLNKFTPCFWYTAILIQSQKWKKFIIQGIFGIYLITSQKVQGIIFYKFSKKNGKKLGFLFIFLRYQASYWRRRFSVSKRVGRICFKSNGKSYSWIFGFEILGCDNDCWRLCEWRTFSLSGRRLRSILQRKTNYFQDEGNKFNVSKIRSQISFLQIWDLKFQGLENEIANFKFPKIKLS